MGHVTVPSRPIHGLDIECPEAPGYEPHFEIPTCMRRELKNQYNTKPKVVIGAGWLLSQSTPKTGVTPVYTARCLSQLGGGPSNLVVDPRLLDKPTRINWGFVGWACITLAVGLLAINSL